MKSTDRQDYYDEETFELHLFRADSVLHLKNCVVGYIRRQRDKAGDEQDQNVSSSMLPLDEINTEL